MDISRISKFLLKPLDWFAPKRIIFSDDELLEYQALTYLSKKQIMKLHNLFCSFDPDVSESEKNPIIHQSVIMQSFSELAVNPFKDRIMKVFCTEEGYISFEDFLEMMSALSEQAPVSVKTSYAFRIYDFDDDDMLSKEDVLEGLKRVTRNQLSNEECEEVVNYVFSEADLDNDGFITFPEFEHLIAKSPDFVHSFRIRV
nr:calcium and integrin-binding family member 2-like [Parasteatoda tepidariorum]